MIIVLKSVPASVGKEDLSAYVVVREVHSRVLNWAVIRFSENGKSGVAVASTYFPHGIDYCWSNEFELFVGFDANEHYRIWGFTDDNQREQELLEYLLGMNVEDRCKILFINLC